MYQGIPRKCEKQLLHRSTFSQWNITSSLAHLHHQHTEEREQIEAQQLSNITGETAAKLRLSPMAQLDKQFFPISLYCPCCWVISPIKNRILVNHKNSSIVFCTSGIAEKGCEHKTTKFKMCIVYPLDWDCLSTIEITGKLRWASGKEIGRYSVKCSWTREWSPNQLRQRFPSAKIVPSAVPDEF